MKKNLLKVFLLSVATAGMVFSSCTNYDDDINDLNQKIEDLSEKVTLKADQSAVAALESKLQGVDFSKYLTSADIEGLATKADLEAAVNQAGEAVKAEIEEAIAGIKTLSEDDVKGIFAEQMKAYDIWGSINTKVADAIQEALKGTLTQSDINTIIAAVVTDINKDGSDIQKAILSIVSKDMQAALADYVTKDVLNGYVKVAVLDGYVTVEAANAKYTAMEAAVEAKLDAANKALVAEITKQIADNNTIQKSDLDKAFAEYDKQIADLWSAVGNLAGRIQSLVYVPASMDGVATFGSYSILGTGSPVSLTKGTDSKATMTFRVSPASLAEALVAGYEAGTVKMSFLPEKLTRANEIKFEVEGVALGKDGKIDVLARTNYAYPAVDETFAVALQVIDSKKSGEDEIETGIEFTSAYVNTKGSGAENVYDNIVLVDANLKVVDPTAISDSIAYNNTTARHKFLDGYKYGYKVSATQIITLKEAAAKYNWDVTPSDSVVIARTNFLDYATVGIGLADVDLDPANPMANAARAKFVTVWLRSADTDNIGTFVADKGNLGIKVGNATVYGSKTYEAKLHITREKLAAITLDTVNFTWKYDTYVGGGQYEKQIQIASGLLTYKQFKDLDFTDPTVTWTCTGAINDANASASVEARLASNPSADSDVQLLNLAVSNYNKGTGALNYKVNVPISNVAEVEFNGVINFKGLPEVTFPINVPAGQYTVDAAAHRLVVPIAANFSDSLYKVNEAALKEFFPTNGKTDFIAFMNNPALTNNFADKVDEKKPGGASSTASPVTSAGLELTSTGALNAYFVSDYAGYYFIDFNDKARYSFSVKADTKVELAAAGFKVNFIKGHEVVINKANNYYLLRGVDLYLNAKNPYLVAPGVRGVNTYTIENVNLANAYKAGSDVTGAVVTYELAARPAGYTDAIGTYPTISGATLDWNSCSLDKVTVTATMKVNGLVTDIKTFDVVRKDILAGHRPVQDTANSLNVLEVNTSGRDTTVSLLKGVTLKDFADSLVIDPAGKLNLNSQDAYKTETVFGTPNYRIKPAGASSFQDAIDGMIFDRLSISDAGILTVSGSNAELANEIEVTVPVKLTHKYSVVETDATTHTWERNPVEFKVVFVIKSK